MTAGRGVVGLGLMLVAAVAVAGCSASASVGSPESADPTSPGVSVPVDDRSGIDEPAPSVPGSEQRSASVAGASAVRPMSIDRRLGAGWAVAAASLGDGLIVATTAGVRWLADGEVGANEGVSVATALGGDVRDIRPSADGRFVALLNSSGHAEIRDVSTLEPLVYSERADDVWFRDDGTAILSDSAGVRQVSLPDGSDVAEVPVAEGSWVISSSADERIVASAVFGAEGISIVWWQEPDDVRTIELDLGPNDVVVKIALTTDDSRLAVATSDQSGETGGAIGVLDLPTGEYVWSRPTQVAAAQSTWLSLDDGRVAIIEGTSFETFDRAGDVVAGGELPSPVQDVVQVGGGWAANTANGRLVSVDASGDVVITPGSYGFASDLQTASNGGDRGDGGDGGDGGDDGGGVVVVAGTGQVDLLRSDGSLEVLTDQFIGAPINDVAIADSGALATAATDGVVEVRLPDNSSVQLLHPEGNVDAVVFGVNSGEVVTGVAQRRLATAFDDTVAFWDVAGPEPARRATRRGEAEPVPSCLFFDNVVRMSPSGATVVASSHDFTVSLFSVDDASEIHRFPARDAGILDLAISPDGAQLAIAADDSTLVVYDLETFELVGEATVDRSVMAMTFLSDGRLVGSDIVGEVFLFDVESGERSGQFEGTKSRSSRLAVSPDSSLVAAGGDGTDVIVWSTSTGEIVATGSGHAGPVTSVEFDGTGTQLLSGSVDGTAIMWQLPG